MTNEELAIAIGEGQKEYIKELYLQCQRLMDILADRFYAAHEGICKRSGVEPEDLKASSFFALIKAIKAYCDSGRVYKFNTYLRYPLQNAFYETVGIKQRKSNPLDHALSFEERLSDDGEITLGETVADDTAAFEEETDRRLSLTGVLPEAERVLQGKGDLYALIYARYIDGKHLRQIAHEQGRNAIEVLRDIRKALLLLRRSYKLKSIAEDVIGRTYRKGSLTFFRQSGYSSVEWAVELMERLERKESKGE